jgi:hypothetical protein
MTERLSTASTRSGAFRGVLDSWFYALEEDAISSGNIDPNDAQALLAATNGLMERRLDSISRQAPSFSAALRGYREALARGDTAIAEGLVAWLSGQPNVAAGVNKMANIKGTVDHVAALSFMQGLLAGHEAAIEQLPDGTTYMIERSGRWVEPVKGDWSPIERLINGLFRDAQAEYILGNLCIWVRDYYNHDYTPRPTMVLAGPKKCGKNVFQEVVVTGILGGKQVFISLMTLSLGCRPRPDRSGTDRASLLIKTAVRRSSI